jgi:VanZ family protein
MPLTQRPLHYRRIWLLLGWGIVAAVAVLSLIPVDIDLGEDRDKLAHLLAYGGMSFWFAALVEGRARQFRIALAFAAMGVALEFLQDMTGFRDFEVADMIANAIGAMLGWGAARTPLKNVLAWAESVLPAGPEP